MYELFEKREKQRKIQELKEVCPDISDEEAARALDYCDGNEEQAATALVSDAGFRRKVLNPGSVVFQSSGPSKRSGAWSAKPTGARPKLIDRASIEGSVFVGAFRGKGFQGKKSGSNKKRSHASAAQAVMMEPLPSDTTSMENNENEKSTAEESAQAELTPENVKKGEAGEDTLPLSQNGETPPTAPKSYALVKEESNGKVRPITESELEKVANDVGTQQSEEQLSQEKAVSQRTPQCNKKKASRTPRKSAQKKSVVAEEKSAHTPSRRSLRQRTIRETLLPEANPITATIMDKVHSASDEDAVVILKKTSQRIATYVLETIGTENPERAVLLRELLDAQSNMQQEVKASPGPQKQKEEAKPTQVPEPEVSSGETTESESHGSVLAAKSSRSSASSRPKRKIKNQAKSLPGEEAKPPALKKQKSPAAESDPSDLIKSAIDQGTVNVISARGHTNRGRVKQKSHKSAELMEVGQLRAEKGWYNAGYIFPEGFKSRTLFRSSVAIDSLCIHECHVLGSEGDFWPAPTFKVVALDRPDEPLIAKSCTGCWTAVLKRINAVIEAKRAAGEDLPPPPRTAIAGPEYFGFNQPDIVVAVESLDPEQSCYEYWAGKAVRQQAAAGLPVPVSQPKPRRSASKPTERPMTRRKKNGRNRYSGSGQESEEEDDEYQYMSNRWSSVSRTERYRNRLQENGEEAAALQVDSDNPVPDIMDPITLEPVIRPAISPFGHVMGAATWKAVLAEQGVCPFTKNPLKWEQCRILTKGNIEAYRDSIIR